MQYSCDGASTVRSGRLVITARRSLATRLLAVFVVGLVTLTLEIAYTRVISFKLFYYYTYFVIGLALLGMGAGSAIVALSSRLRSMDPLALIRTAAPISALVGIASYGVVARLGTTTDQIWAGQAGEALNQLGRLLALSISLTAVFLALGIMLAALIVAEAHEVRRLYFWDLTGAALACLIAVPLQSQISPPMIIFGCMALLALLGLYVSWTLDRTRRLAIVAGAAIAVLFTGVLSAGLNIQGDSVKTLALFDLEPSESLWGPVFRVDVVELDDDIAQLLVHDGLWGSALWRYDGTPATTIRFDNDSRRIPFDAIEGEPERVLIIGAAGGNEIQASLTYGVGAVDAVELNPVTVDLVTNRFADYIGNVADDPRVNYVRGDGRTFLARSEDLYDIIWFVAPDSYAASNAATSGAFVLSESYLYTEEMIRKAYDRLSDDGLIMVQFGDFDFDNRPNRTARYLVTARSALDDEVESFADHVALITDATEFALGRFSSILISRQPLNEQSLSTIEDTVSQLSDSAVVHLPGRAPGASITADIIRADESGLAALIAGYDYEISTITDDRPFFWHFSGFSDVLFDWSRGFEDTEIAIGERLLLVLLFISVVVAAALLWVPFALTKRRVVDPMPRRRGLLVYFAALGLGFMLVEISMIQRFALLLGYPTLSLSVSLFTVLIATAVGARWSGWVRLQPMRAMVLAPLALALLSVVYLVGSGPLTDIALAWDSMLRIALVIALLFPVGVLLGVFLPFGIDLAVASAPTSATEGRLVAWCWAVNGFFSVMGALLTTIISMTIGFNRTLLSGVVLYFVAAAAGAALARRLQASGTWAANAPAIPAET